MRRCLGAVTAAAHIPQLPNDWLEGPDADFELAETQLTAGTDFLRTQGLTHFHAHFNNILTDGRQLYFADFGLAACDRFDGTGPEQPFLDEHRDLER